MTALLEYLNFAQYLLAMFCAIFLHQISYDTKRKKVCILSNYYQKSPYYCRTIPDSFYHQLFLRHNVRMPTLGRSHGSLRGTYCRSIIRNHLPGFFVGITPSRLIWVPRTEKFYSLYRLYALNNLLWLSHWKRGDIIIGCWVDYMRVIESNYKSWRIS